LLTFLFILFYFDSCFKQFCKISKKNFLGGGEGVGEGEGEGEAGVGAWLSKWLSGCEKPAQWPVGEFKFRCKELLAL
ncbi:hypothetical protein, partial [Klebsiella pneumoniae]|uniref:hypothetical protein n=1 Tax=Klebsiella pneumoniae TaxID=573 RepID=UPI001C82D29D